MSIELDVEPVVGTERAPLSDLLEPPNSAVTAEESAAPKVQPAPKAVLFGIGLGVAGLALTFSTPIGLGVSLFLVLLLGTLAVYAHQHEVKPARLNLWMLIPIAFSLLMIVVRSEGTLNALNFTGLACGLLLWLDFFHIGNVFRTSVANYPIKIMNASLAVSIQPIEELQTARQWIVRQKNYGQRLAPILRGLLITVPIVGIFALLLGSADSLFNKLLLDIASALLPNNPFMMTIQLTYLLGIAWFSIGVLAFAVSDRKPKRAAFSTPLLTTEPFFEALPQSQARTWSLNLGFTETTMLLGSLCAVFGVFVAIQFVYLFGGARNIANFSFADYARRGFAELVVVGVLTLGLGFGIDKIAIRRTRQAEHVFRALLTGLFALTGVILVSAFLRMHLYEVTYGFTTLRLAVYAAIGALGALLFGFTLSLYWHPLKIDVFGTTCLITFFGFIAILNLLNPDAFVARENIERGDIDPLYLSTLSLEAVPALVPLLDSPDAGTRQIITYALTQHWRELQATPEVMDWRAFNIGRQTSVDLLRAAQPKLDTNTPRTITYSLTAFQGKLRSGQTVRETLRQFGTPYNNLYEFRGRNGRTSVRVDYLLSESQSNLLSLIFDTVTGLETACANYQGSNCLALAPHR